jgi:DNA mismatch repair protein MutS2
LQNLHETSSEEASALAMAIFKYLKESDSCHTIVSSHHQTLKTIMHQNEDFISAHVGFNLELNQPTYKIHIGSPGSSYALNIFKDMTKDDSHFNNLYHVAINYLDNKAVHYEKLLESISQKENQLNKYLLENKELNLQLKNQKESMQGIIKLKIDEKILQTNQKIDKILGDAKKLLREVREKDITKDNKLHTKVVELKSRVKSHSPFNEEEVNPQEKPNLYAPESFEEGQYYYCLLVNKTVLLKKIYLKKGEAQVSVGNMNLKCPLSKLMIANKKPQRSEQTVSVHVDRKVDVRLEYDCRGMRLSDFQDLIYNHTSDLLMGDVPFLNIIHGHGDGVLKGWLHSFIKNHKDLVFDSSDDGNDGSSRIILS